MLESESTPGPQCVRERLYQWKILMKPSGIEPATFRLVARISTNCQLPMASCHLRCNSLKMARIFGRNMLVCIININTLCNWVVERSVRSCYFLGLWFEYESPPKESIAYKWYLYCNITLHISVRGRSYGTGQCSIGQCMHTWDTVYW
jgi:hypothetical protein